MKLSSVLLGLLIVVGCLGHLGQAVAQKASAEIEKNEMGKARVLANQQFHLQSVQEMGVLIPLYIYPADIHTNKNFNRVMELKRQYVKVPFWVVLNPASGPGDAEDANYKKAIDRLIGSGCMVLGYVATGYGKKPVADVQRELKAWQRMYPRVQGIFFDEMIYEDNEAGVAHQKQLNSLAHSLGYWPTVGNPGAQTPGRYFVKNAAADVVVVHEAASWPTEAALHGDYFGGYADYPPATRAILMHSQKTVDPAAIKMARNYTRWIYVTQDTYKANDAAHANPWDELSIHLEAICKTLSQ